MSRGNIRKRAKGSYTLQWYVGRDPETGKPRYKSRTVKGGKKAAEAELARILHEQNTGQYVDPARMTVAAYLEYWTEHYVKNLSPKTIDCYRTFLQHHIVPALGHHRLCDLKTLHVQGLISGLTTKSGNTPSQPTQQKVRNIIHKALACAVEWQLVPRNACDGVRIGKNGNGGEKGTEVRALTRKQLDGLLAAAKGTVYYLPALIAVTTGMRRGEVLALHWEDVDITGRVITVRRSLEQTDDGSTRIKEPKSAAGRRRVPLVDALAVELERVPEGERVGLVVRQASGRHYQPNSFGRNWARFVEQRKQPDITFHELRHTFATLALQANVNVKVLQEWLGHENIQTTLNLYGHVIATMWDTAQAQINDVFCERMSK